MIFVTVGTHEQPFNRLIKKVDGGLYFDTDVEVIKDMSDIIKNGAFMGCERSDKCNSGLGLGAEPGLGLYKEILENYHRSHFLNNDGSNNYESALTIKQNV